MRDMAEQVEIFRASLEDAIEILTLQKLAYQSEAQIYDDWFIPPLLQTAEEIRDEFSNSVFLKAISEHSIIGSVRSRVIKNTCHIGRLIVHPEWQNLGIGTRLMTEVELMYRDVARFELFTGSNSIRNIHLYHKLGYQEFRREPLGSKVELVYLEKIVIGKKEKYLI
ncbi:GNAT family N-acetyltransferase [Methanosarcina sp.]|uniref:GNAT family N-acetyltransferase n=2 Tax=Methanosarcina sp. TaxID=2213 RepID=UPI002988AE29|nr:GNAT family N-acetyltransferase [Methanosarcina sp.]MDW5549275.1 GNAT family N-acetyltransferase [Methanosarcina sp.]MDW5553021.1 GNAT family N-acetyltransferase [Methanosarcina sp.]MDW5559454.1 GNAT family N-acetyltransferase [Methanosarcina sp.]